MTLPTTDEWLADVNNIRLKALEAAKLCTDNGRFKEALKFIKQAEKAEQMILKKGGSVS